MKNSSLKTTILLKAIDLELKAIIEQDLKHFRKMEQHKKNLVFLQQIAA